VKSNGTLFGKFKSMYEIELELLRNLPLSLQSLVLEPPRKYRICSNLKDESAEELISELCRLSVEKDRHQLHSVVLKGIKFPQGLDEYLTFMFGFNNRFQNEDNSYWMIFR